VDDIGVPIFAAPNFKFERPGVSLLRFLDDNQTRVGASCDLQKVFDLCQLNCTPATKTLQTGSRMQVVSLPFDGCGNRKAGCSVQH